ncbi:MAG: hypothetical protein HYV07_05370 [Deltaproteobacteria bacterium]|nr:hypothetical protein [Deltaproteobacteria bacterium]
MSKEGRPSALSRLANAFDVAFRGLSAPADDDVLERLSVLVHECMSGRGRSFHDVEHALEIGRSTDPVQILAGLFHDVVYFQVDGGLGTAQRFTHDAIEILDGTVRVTGSPDPTDQLANDVIAVFGMKPGQTLSVYGGLNELASAFVAVRSLAPILAHKDLVAVAAAIEATIPFRPDGPDGCPLETLFKRLRRVGFSEDEAERTVLSALEVVNRDVQNFAFENSAEFLDHTWMLLPESNWSLRTNTAYALSEYRTAIERMERFLTGLAPTLVFSAFRGRPDPETLEAMTRGAARNIRIGSKYLRAKCVAARVLESLAMATGGDGPVSLFMGDLPDAKTPTLSIEDFFAPSPRRGEDQDAEVFSLLAYGRASETSFDLRNAPLAAYLYGALGDAATEKILTELRAGKSALELLPSDVLKPLIEAIAAIASTRRRRLLALLPPES